MVFYLRQGGMSIKKENKNIVKGMICHFSLDLPLLPFYNLKV